MKRDARRRVPHWPPSLLRITSGYRATVPLVSDDRAMTSDRRTDLHWIPVESQKFFFKGQSC